MINQQEIEDGLWLVLQELVGEEIPVIIAEQSSPIPKTDFVTIKVLNFLPIGRKRIRNNADDPTLFDIISDGELLVTVDGYGKNSKSIISNIAFNIANNPNFSDKLLNVARLAIKAQPNVMDSSTFLETSWEQRSKIDVLFFASEKQTVDLGYIEQIQLDPEYNCSNVVFGTINIPNQ